jgi:hypothetical protein
MIQNREMTGIISAPQHRLVTQKLPGVFDARDRLEPGDRVSDADMRFLPVSVSNAMPAKPVFYENPVPARVGAESVMLYRGMPLKALGSECSLSA